MLLWYYQTYVQPTNDAMNAYLYYSIERIHFTFKESNEEHV